MKKTIKWIGALLGVGVLLGTVLVIQSIYFRPFDIRVFYEKIFIERLLDDPELLTQLGLVEQFGINGHNARLTDASPRHTEKTSAWERKSLRQLHAYDRAHLDAGQRLSYDVLDTYLTTSVAGDKYRYHNYPVNQMFGVQSQSPTFMATIHPLTSAEDAEFYVQRLSLFREKFDQVLEGLRLRESKAILPPRFVVEKVLSEMRGFIDKKPRENILFTSFAKRLDKVDGLSEGAQARLLEGAEKQIRETVYPAYQNLIAYFEALQKQPLANNGVWSLPDGDEYYAWEVRSNTTTDLSPEEIHALGLKEVERIESEMDHILQAQGYVEGSVGERMAALAREPRFLYPDDEQGRKQILADYQAILDEIDARLGPYFDVRPRSGVEVKPIPAFKEKTSPVAYYNAPSMDGNRPGVFYANMSKVATTYKWGMKTLAYHEAIPGHHFQISIARELKGLPTFRTVLPFTAYVEGWALYAERLARDIGMEEDPYDDLGRLQAEMFRAVRLVVDTGLHRKRWSRERAIAYMLEKTGLPKADVIAEVERYLVMPGQALAYKIGMLKILELREKAKSALGGRFSYGGFHDAILKNGALPLSLLEQVVDRYIARELEEAGL
ncbi:DUF885 domain-containing protein [Thiolapillus sp.]